MFPQLTQWDQKSPACHSLVTNSPCKNVREKPMLGKKATAHNASTYWYRYVWDALFLQHRKRLPRTPINAEIPYVSLDNHYSKCP